MHFALKYTEINVSQYIIYLIIVSDLEKLMINCKVRSYVLYFQGDVCFS